MRGRKVVLYTASTATGGAEIALRNLVQAFDSKIDVTVMGVDARTCEWIACGRPVVIVPPVRNKLAVGAFVAHRRAISRLRPDVFHANLREMADARHALLAAITVRGIAVVAVDQLPMAPASRLPRAVARAVSKRLARRIAVGIRAARIVETELGLESGSVGAIYNGVADLGAAAVRARAEPVVVGTFARLDRIKGLDVLLEAVAPLDVHLVIAGEGPERDTLAEQCSRLGISDRVRFAGWLDDPRTLFDEIDIYALPSRNEGFPLSIVEAMLAGRPVVATDVGSVDEAVIDGTTGRVVPADDVAALRSALAALASDPALRRQMGESGRERALTHFTADAMAQSFETLYDEVTA